MELRERIKTARKALGLSQEALARRADVSLSLVNQIERGVVVDPHFSTLTNVAKALSMSVSELLGSAEERRVLRIRPRVGRLRKLELTALRDHEHAVLEQLAALKRVVPFGSGGTKEEITDDAKYSDLMDEWFAIYQVLAETAVKQLSPGE
jgi:transcriptional regulator with XRE-family HTH domain